MLFLILLLAPAGATSVDTLAHDAARTHPRVLAAQARARAAGANVEAQGWWPQPQLAVQISPLPIETRHGPAWGTIKLGQALPWGGALDAQVASAQAQARAAEAQLAQTRIAVARAVRRAAAELQRVDAEHAINARTTALVQRLVEQVQARLAVDTAAQADVLDAQVALARLENVGLDLAQQRAIAQAQLNVARGVEATAPVPALSAPAPAAEALDALLTRLQAHPQLAAWQARAQAARAQQSAAGYARLPRFKLGVGYTVIGEPDSPAGGTPGQDALHLEAGVSLPLWSNADAAEARAEATAQAAQAAENDAERALVLAVMTHHARLETALRATALYAKSVLPLARQRMDVLEAAYAADRARFTTVLDAQRALERYETEHVRARARAAQALADLRAAVGEMPK